jgi:hypothetical protein
MVLIKVHSFAIHILKLNADIFFNKPCLTKKIVPNYANIKVPATSTAAHKTQSKAQITRIKEEIKFLYKKKDKINKDLYKAHLKVAQEWGNLWHPILQMVQESVNNVMNKKHKNLHQKLNKLEV